MPARVKVRINQAGVLAACRQEGVFRDLERRTDLVAAAAEAAVNNQSGAYRRGLKKERFIRRGVAGVRLTATAGHSAVLEFGSRPHIIEAKNGAALSWPGARHPVRKVHHPGTAAQHILRNALRAARG
jgi:hypothetical protein